jgi:hypothetical protein
MNLVEFTEKLDKFSAIVGKDLLSRCTISVQMGGDLIIRPKFDGIAEQEDFEGVMQYISRCTGFVYENGHWRIPV